MSGHLTIRNWDKWQTYRKDRQQPPWIKLHRELMRNAEWVSLSDAQRGQLIAIWMLAADRNGQIPDDPALIQKLCFMSGPPDLKHLMAHGFIDASVTPRRRHRDARPTPDRRQGDALEEKREEAEVEAEENKKGVKTPDEILSPLNAVLKKATSEAVVAYRRSIKQPLTPLASQRLAAQLGKWVDPEDAAAEMMLRGWRGFKPEWMIERGTGPPAKEKHFRNVVQDYIEEVDSKHGNGRRAICGASGVGNLVELHAAAPGLENHAQALDESSDWPPEIDVAKNG